MNTIFTEKTASAVFLKIGIMDALDASKAFNSNSKKSAETFYSLVINKVVNNMHTSNVYKSILQVQSGFAKYGIKNSTDLVNAIVEAKDNLKKSGYAGVAKVKSIKEYKKFKSVGKKSHVGLDPVRTVAVRSQYGQFPVLFYENFSGTMDSRNNKQLTQIKLDYHYATGCKYYEARPILLSSWLDLDDERKICTCNSRKDKDDLTTY